MACSCGNDGLVANQRSQISTLVRIVEKYMSRYGTDLLEDGEVETYAPPSVLLDTDKSGFTGNDKEIPPCPGILLGK